MQAELQPAPQLLAGTDGAPEEEGVPAKRWRLEGGGGGGTLSPGLQEEPAVLRLPSLARCMACVVCTCARALCAHMHA